jgi:hypothetical protein
MSMTEMSEAQSVSFLRNALLVAGMEMGMQGDHWPVVKSTIHSIVKDWEELQIERNVFEELKTHLYADLREMDRIAAAGPADIRANVEPKLKELREVYDAYFSGVTIEPIDFDSPDMPDHIKRAKVIADTLEDDDGR